LYHRLTRFYVASLLNRIFMLGGAPEPHEVSSKTPHRKGLGSTFSSNAGVLLEAFPIKASDNPEFETCGCGFANQAHLTLAFRKECGLTPGDYRRQL
jgi:hypothetical protein